jgi:predicted Zn-dependent protease
MLENLAGDAVCIVCLSGWQFRDPVEVAGLIVHESVHVWQHYAARIGEHAPSAEQEAYAIQSIAQELMAEFARRAASFAELIDARSR